MTGPRPRTLPKQPLTRARIAAICGDITDAQASALIRAGVTEPELEQAAAWAVGESDVMGKARRPLSGGVAAAYDILTTTQEFEEQPD